MTKFTKMLFVALAIFVLQVSGQAQTTGAISGTVSDPGNAVVAGATVTVSNIATGAERTAVTNSSGAFDFQALPPGTYSASVEAAGFKKAVVREVTVSVASTAQLNIEVEIGLANETVTVTTAQEVINSTSPSLTNVINTRQVVDLPLGGRNPVALAALQAGIAVIGDNTRGASVGGLRQTAVNLTQDGINAMDNFVKTSSFFAVTTPSLNSTAEFSITTGTVGADAGRGAAQVNLVTKGGSNDFHGNGFLQLINESYNANTFFNNFNGTAKPILRQHFYGGDIGGPVYFPRFGEGGPSYWSGKDKAFFFFSYEAFRQNQGRANNRNGVLTQEARNGIFRYVGTNGVLQTVNLLSIGTVKTLNPLMTAHLAQIPVANNFNCSTSDGFNIGCYTFNVSENNSNDKYVARYDHQLVDNTQLGSHKLEFIYSRVVTNTRPDVFTNGIDAPFPGGVNGFQASTRNLITPALVSTFGSNWTNIVRYGRQWAPIDFNRESEPTAPFLSLPGVLINYDNTFMPQPRNTIVNQVTDTLSWVNGNHSWKFGADWQNVLGVSRNDAGINKTIQLGTNAANGTGFTLANLPFGSNANLTAATTTYTAIVGNLASASQTFNVNSPDSGFVEGATRLRLVQEKDLALFASDQWRMRSNLTLTYGVRWDYMGVPTVPNGLAIQPKYEDLYGISGFGNLFNPTATPGSQTQGVATLKFISGETGIGLYKNDWNNFAPSVGVAYSPAFKSGLLRKLFGDEGTSSIRGGYSVSYLHDGITTFTNLLGVGTTNPGLIAAANLSPLSLTNPPTANIRGVLTGGGVPLVTPTFKVPITDRENFLANSGNGLWTADPNLRSPYVHQFSFGIEREIFKDTALEIRYQGNIAPNTWRAQDINEINIFENGFLQEFINAQKNLVARGGSSFAPGCATCVPLPLFDRFFGLVPGGTAVAAASGYSSSTFITNLNRNDVGLLASTLAFNQAYRTNRESVQVGLPANFFVANPNATFARVLRNDSRSNYNALEIEVRRRFSNGLQFQADYTFSKALGDAVDAQGNNQNDLVNRLTLRNPDLDYRRSTEDQTHRFVANGVYELPFGNGRRFLNSSNWALSRLAGGWTMGAIVVWSSSPPFFISSGRSTFTSSATNNGAQLLGISFEEFKNNLGLFKTPSGVFFINPAILDITLNSAGKVATSKLKPGLMTAPAPGTFGNFPVNSLNGPNYFNFDLSVTKRIPITERVRFEFKVTAINILNHPNFVFNNQNFDSTAFGLITTQRGTARNINFIGQISF
ncbi:MAG TPA: carboxypeptidase-like regulatory domain-containing protein [Pyrinomonadaceae bacterium]|nr:carboxypeptidase-like regulatory domain-containing protein [Pyrinomonadaceae bacterium]